jgi:Mg-chelatase subunit ChlD
MNHENLGAAERIVQAVLTYSDHMVHNRPGVVVRDPSIAAGVRWAPVTHVVNGAEKTVFRLDKVGKKTAKTRLGVLRDDGSIVNGAALVGRYQPAGIFPEVAAWIYRQVAEVYRLDHEFAARWASFAFGEEHRDLKVVLAAFMLVQARRGDPVVDDGKVAFYDDDFRDVGEAMILVRRKDGKDLHPKLLLRIHDLLSLPEIAAINRDLGFGKSARKPFLGRWPKAVEKWLRFREENPKLLEGLVAAGFRTSVIELARRVGYKPTSGRFFETLRWKQSQAEDGRRALVIGETFAPSESWDALDEAAICMKIVETKPSWKVVVGRVPKAIGVTRAIAAAAIEAGSLSAKDLVIATPTLEALGLLEFPEIKARWTAAVAAAEDRRAANVAQRVKSKETAEILKDAADEAVKKAVAEVARDLRVYFFVDISGSMEGAIEKAKADIATFLQGFPLDRLHVAVFNTVGREIRIPHASAAGVTNAFRGIVAGGGTDYGQGVWALRAHKPLPNEDALMIFIGDEEDGKREFSNAVKESGLAPMSFGLVRVGGGRGRAVRETARVLGIPCFEIDERTFADPYAIPRTIRALVSATPVAAATPDQPKARVTLVETILKTALLTKPSWAA